MVQITIPLVALRDFQNKEKFLTNNL